MNAILVTNQLCVYNSSVCHRSKIVTPLTQGTSTSTSPSTAFQLIYQPKSYQPPGEAYGVINHRLESNSPSKFGQSCFACRPEAVLQATNIQEIRLITTPMLVYFVRWLLPGRLSCCCCAVYPTNGLKVGVLPLSATTLTQDKTVGEHRQRLPKPNGSHLLDH